MNRSKSLVAVGVALAALAGTQAAQAAACSTFGGPGVKAGTATSADVTYNGSGSDACVISAVNPQRGPGGNTAGFSDAFGTGWDLLAKVNGGGSVRGGSPFVYEGVTFTTSISGIPGKSGQWTLTASQDVSMDLVFAMHGANRSGAFFFDDLNVVSGGNGTWSIQWLNKGGRVPDYSNLTLFARDLEVTPVPEPETYALSLAGIAGVCFLVRRRRSS